MKKLISHTLRAYTLFAAVLLLLSAPLFYILLERAYLEEVDETLIWQREKFSKNAEVLLAEADIPKWNRLNPDKQILHPKAEGILYEPFNQTFTDTVTNTSEPYRVLLSPLSVQGKQYLLMVRANYVDAEDLIRTIAFLYFGILGVFLGGIVLITQFISRRTWRPFYNTLNTIERFDLNKPSVPNFPDSRIYEFNRLNHALKQLIEGNMRAYSGQKEFTENASHELQTPLAVIRAKLDSLLQEPQLSFRQADLISSLFEAVSRMSRLSKNLLLLSKIENHIFSYQDSFDLSTVLKRMLPDFREMAGAKGLELDISCQYDSCMVTGNEVLTEIALQNLLSNAIRHTAGPGSILIELNTEGLTVSNTGDTQLPEKRLYERFSRPDNPTSGTGLGLALVKQICEQQHWKISYQFQESRHFFHILFPPEFLQNWV